MFIGFLFIIVGGVYFLKNTGFLTQEMWSLSWPLALVALGVYLVYKHHRMRMWRERIWKKYLEE